MNKPPYRLLRVAIGLLVLSALLTLTACASEPWVQPYDRERLAAPLMQPSRHALAERHRAHVQEVREGARGATTAQGGGCGCN
jgi:hypothetical protein